MKRLLALMERLQYVTAVVQQYRINKDAVG